MPSRNRVIRRYKVISSGSEDAVAEIPVGTDTVPKTLLKRVFLQLTHIQPFNGKKDYLLS